MGTLHKRPKVHLVETVYPNQILEQFGQEITIDSVAAKAHIYGGFTVVDLEDLHLLEKYRWNLRPHRKTAYVTYQGSEENLRFHRLLLQIADHLQVDHINRIGWDNRRSNLRLTTPAGNSQNHGPSKNKKWSSFKGVTFVPKKKLYRARIMVNRKPIYLGSFKKELDAANAYNEAAKKYFGEFAFVNLT